MNFFILVLIVCLLLFLYIIYFLSHDDFVILRHDVSMEKIFNTGFLFSFVSLFSARLFYVLLNPQPVLLNPLGFLLFPYFPGLSLAGGLLGGFAFLLFFLKVRNLPIGRIFDFFSFAFLVSSPIGFFGYFLLIGQRASLNFFLSFILILVLVSVFIRFLLPLSLSGKLKDGSLGILFLISFSAISFLINIILNGKLVLSLENLILLGISIALLIPFVKQEGYEWYQSYLRRR